MATKKSHRIGILIIAIVMTLGTLGGFLVMVLAPQNEAKDQAKAQADYQKQLEEYNKQAEAAAMANKPLDGYEVTTFDKASVKELKTEVLKQGDGAELNKDSTISANYFGWTSDGKIFDSTNKDGVVTPAQFPLSGVIAGWTQGLTGVKVGSVVRLTIPSDLAYGANGAGSIIGPNEPLAFVVEVVELK